MKRALFYFLLLLAVSAFFVPLMVGGSIQDQTLSVRKDSSPAKKKFPQGYFVEPTDSSLRIAGNFGEIRPNHFHAGIDVKTGGREGLPIYAVADGYVSRVKISANGYGKALYITHPNGFVSVYAHLQRLQGRIAEYVRNEQYKFETFEIDITIPKNVLRVKQCDTVALSGNTGGSQSPHLHFEIRDEVTENAYNPFVFGYKIDDTVPPKLVTLAVYPANDTSFVNGKNSPRKTRIYGSRGKYKLSSAERFTVSGDIGFGLEVYDYANIAEAGKLGAYSIDLFIDGRRIYYHELNELSFDESRYINSHIDYAEDAKSNREIQKCFRDENNMLSIYQCVVNEGVFRFNDTAFHPVKFVVKDFFGNTSVLQFQVKSRLKTIQNAVPLSKHPLLAPLHFFACNNFNNYETDHIKIEIPPCALYSDIDFNYSMSKIPLPKTFAPVHSVHKPQVPVHYNYILSLKAKNIPERLHSKATIVLLDAKNNMTAVTSSLTSHSGGEAPSLGGKAGDGVWLTAQTKYFGRFTVALDTFAPFIKPYNIYNNKNMGRSKTISVLVGDNLTGVKSYRATIDGQWILMEYEPKKAMLFYEFDERVGKGKHVFQVEVTDGKNNTRTYKANFVR